MRRVVGGVRVTAGGASNVWVASVPPALLAEVSHMPSLNTLAPLTRLTNAQYPNYDFETEHAEIPQPWGPGGSVVNWTTPALFGPPASQYFMDPNLYSSGKGGACGHWRGDTGTSGNYYCGVDNATGGGWVECDMLLSDPGFLGIPIGLFYNMTMLPHWATWNLPPFTDLASYKSKPTLTVWQGSAGGGGGWFNNRFFFTSHDGATGHIGLTPDGTWPSGGWQGGRTWHTVDPSCGTTGPLVSGNFHINGVFEELDAPGEFYLDVANAKLYLFYNNSVFPPGTPQPAPDAPPPASLVLVSPQLEVFFNLSGSADAPVTDVTFAGIDFRDQRDGFLEDWIVPSGGDWGTVFLAMITNSPRLRPLSPRLLTTAPTPLFLLCRQACGAPARCTSRARRARRSTAPPSSARTAMPSRSRASTATRPSPPQNSSGECARGVLVLDAAPNCRLAFSPAECAHARAAGALTRTAMPLALPPRRAQARHVGRHRDRLHGRGGRHGRRAAVGHCHHGLRGERARAFGEAVVGALLGEDAAHALRGQPRLQRPASDDQLVRPAAVALRIATLLITTLPHARVRARAFSGSVHYDAFSPPLSLTPARARGRSLFTLSATTALAAGTTRASTPCGTLAARL